MSEGPWFMVAWGIFVVAFMLFLLISEICAGVTVLKEIAKTLREWR